LGNQNEEDNEELNTDANEL